jgi:hypothetical protein
LTSNGFSSDLSVLDPKAGTFQAVSAADENQALNQMISEAKTFMEHAAMNARGR